MLFYKKSFVRELNKTIEAAILRAYIYLHELINTQRLLPLKNSLFLKLPLHLFSKKVPRKYFCIFNKIKKSINVILLQQNALKTGI